jgi:hypothetical protein
MPLPARSRDMRRLELGVSGPALALACLRSRLAAWRALCSCLPVAEPLCSLRVVVAARRHIRGAHCLGPSEINGTLNYIDRRHFTTSLTTNPPLARQLIPAALSSFLAPSLGNSGSRIQLIRTRTRNCFRDYRHRCPVHPCHAECDESRASAQCTKLSRARYDARNVETKSDA